MKSEVLTTNIFKGKVEGLTKLLEKNLYFAYHVKSFKTHLKLMSFNFRYYIFIGIVESVEQQNTPSHLFMYPLKLKL